MCADGDQISGDICVIYLLLECCGESEAARVDSPSRLTREREGWRPNRGAFYMSARRLHGATTRAEGSRHIIIATVEVREGEEGGYSAVAGCAARRLFVFSRFWLRSLSLLLCLTEQQLASCCRCVLCAAPIHTKVLPIRDPHTQPTEQQTQAEQWQAHTRGIQGQYGSMIRMA